MVKRKIYFERVPVETVRKIAKLDFPDTEQEETRRVKEKRRSERLVSGKKIVSKRAKYDDSRV
jgi:hypothetical protein